MQVRDVLKAKGNPRLITIGPEATVSTAISRLVDHNIGSLPVVDAEGRLVGIFTERDVLRGVGERSEGFCKTRIEDVMVANPIACDADDDVQHAMGKMSDNQIGQLPVLNGQELVGIFSVGDVVRILYEHAEHENRHQIGRAHV